MRKTHIPLSSLDSCQNKIHLCSFQRPSAVDVGFCPVLSGSLEHEVHSLCVFRGYQSVDGVRAENALCGSCDAASYAVRTWLYAQAEMNRNFTRSSEVLCNGHSNLNIVVPPARLPLSISHSSSSSPSLSLVSSD